MNVAQPIWLSDCPLKGHFSAKNTKNAFWDNIVYGRRQGVSENLRDIAGYEVDSLEN